MRHILAAALLSLSPIACGDDPEPTGNGNANGNQNDNENGNANSDNANQTPNQAPAAPIAVGVTPTEPRTGDALTVSFTLGDDPDGDRVTPRIRWTRNGVDTGFTGETLPAFSTARGDVWQAFVATSDGDLSSAEISASVTVQNSAPMPPMVEIVTLDGGLLCRNAVNGTDDDRDALTYAYSWQRDGTPFAEAETVNGTDDFVPETATAPGEEWTCAATSTDGDATSAASMEASTTIGAIAEPSVVAFAGASCLLSESGNVECWGNDRVRQVTPAPRQPLSYLGQASATICGLDRDDLPICWGRERFGATQAPLVPMIAVAAGDGFACGLDRDRRAICWGQDDFGQTRPPAGAFEAIGLGATHGCGLRENGSIECWGANTEGQLDVPLGLEAIDLSVYRDASCAVTMTGDVRCWGQVGTFFDKDGDFARVAVGASSLCTLDAAGAVECAESSNFNVEETTPSAALRSLSGNSHYCGLSVEGNEPVCWGQNAWGQTVAPSRVDDVAAVDFGSESGCVLDSTGQALCLEAVAVPNLEAPARPFRKIAAGSDWGCGIALDDDSLVCFGGSAFSPPTGAFSDVSIDGDIACAIRAADGGIECFGGSLALPSDDPGTGYVEVQTTTSLVCARDAADAVRCWPPGGATYEAFAGPVLSFGNGGESQCAVLQDKSVVCNTSDSNLDAFPTGPFESISVTRSYACGLRSDGSVFCRGELNDNDSQFPVPTLLPLKSVDTHDFDGSVGACGIDTGDGFRCWGALAR